MRKLDLLIEGLRGMCSMRRIKFKVYYPEDHEDESLRGKRFKPKRDCMVVINEQGMVYHVDKSDYISHVLPLCMILPKYDIRLVNSKLEKV
jgi:hypothetical protein